MKQVLVKTKYDEICSYLMLSNIDDILEYSETLSIGVANTLRRILASNVNIDRWDHMVGRNDPDGVMGGAINAANIKGTNPIYEVGPLVDSKIANMLKYVAKGEIILVNSNGGYCPFTENYHEIIEESEHVAVREQTHVINKDTKYINLENDPVLEKHTIEYLGTVDPNYSHVCQLRNYTIEELTNVFNEFQANGGDTVYVYTTGMDIPQMYEYSDAIIQSGLIKVELELNAGHEQEHDDVIKYLEEHDVDVQVL